MRARLFWHWLSIVWSVTRAVYTVYSVPYSTHCAHPACCLCRAPPQPTCNPKRLASRGKNIFRFQKYLMLSIWVVLPRVAAAVMEDGQIPRKIWQVPHFVATLISSDLQLTTGHRTVTLTAAQSWPCSQSCDHFSYKSNAFVILQIPVNHRFSTLALDLLAQRSNLKLLVDNRCSKQENLWSNVQLHIGTSFQDDDGDPVRHTFLGQFIL